MKKLLLGMALCAGLCACESEQHKLCREATDGWLEDCMSSANVKFCECVNREWINKCSQFGNLEMMLLYHQEIANAAVDTCAMQYSWRK